MNTYNNGRPQNNRAFAGLFLIALGTVYLLRQFNFFLFPHWLFSWEMILIAIGLATGARNNFRHPGSIIMIAIGTLFLIRHIFYIHFFFIWPLVLIGVGVSLLLRRRPLTP